MGTETDLVAQAAAGGHTSGDGPFTRRCHTLLSDALEGAKVMLTTSCTHALEMAALLAEIGPGDEVIVPSYTFVSAANAFALRGAEIRFADIDPRTLNLDVEHAASLVGPSTRAVVPVHYSGVACDMAGIGALADRHDLTVIEDNAHGLFGTHQGRALGTLGRMSTVSFHQTKNFQCGEGGAIVLNDPSLVERAEIIREKGTNRVRFQRGEVARYTWVDVGSSYLPSDLLAAFLLAQLEARDEVLARRAHIHRRYAAALTDWADAAGVTLPVGGDTSTHHVFHLLLADETTRDAMISHLATRGVAAVFHYVPLHLSPMGQRFGGAPGDCPVAEDVSVRLVRLPLFHSLGDRQIDQVVDAVTSFEPPA